MRRIAELTEGGFTIFIGNKYMIIRRKFEEYMDNVASKNTVEQVGLCIVNVPRV